MNDADYLSWPFFDGRHRDVVQEVQAWIAELGVEEANPTSRSDLDTLCRRLVARMGKAGLLHHCVALPGKSGADIDSRSICLLREHLACQAGLLDFVFAMQGLGSGAISLDGTPAQREHYLPLTASGDYIAAFALSEPDAGSDVGALACTAEKQGGSYVLNGEKTWISNGGIADYYVVFAREKVVTPITAATSGAKGISAFIVDAATPGLEIAERIDVMAPHPLARLRFADCRVSSDKLLGAPGEGFKLAMRTLDIFRTSVAAAALGFSRRALREGTARALSRPMFGATLADFQLTQAKLAQMATLTDASALLVYRAAWLRDSGGAATREAAMAKMAATENAQFVIDAALQMHGGLGVRQDHIMERLYRDIRALRIYEGATEVQQLIIGRDIVKQARGPAGLSPERHQSDIKPMQDRS